jgi:hypothetical protein
MKFAPCVAAGANGRIEKARGGSLAVFSGAVKLSAVLQRVGCESVLQAAVCSKKGGLKG